MNADSSFGPGTCIGLVGLGLVGSALAKRLKLAGYVCIGFDIRPEAMRVFESLGFETANSVSHMLNRSNTMVLAVFDTAGVIDVVDQINRHRSHQTQEKQPLLTLIDCSTGDPFKVAELSKQLALQNIHLIEAPLSGSSVQI
jgi:2-hydroxy-3-oxopropionate reductase